MKYEIINPSDYCTIEHDSLLAAAVACLLLGRGQYALEPVEEGAEKVPMFMFGGFEGWWGERSDVNVNEWMDTNKEVLAEAMESVERPGERTSMNDINGRADAWAERLRRQLLDGPAAPQQVFGS